MCGICCTPEPPAAPRGSREHVADAPDVVHHSDRSRFRCGAWCGMRAREGRPKRQRRPDRTRGEVCAHGRGRACDRTHHDDDPELGEPICPDCYDYPAAVAFNWRAPELWRRFTIALRRRLAAQLGMTEAALGRRCGSATPRSPSSNAAASCTSTRSSGIDGAGDGYPPATVTLTDEEFTAAVIARAAGEAMCRRRAERTIAVAGSVSGSRSTSADSGTTSTTPP